jgi:thiamine biosynthesis protein ThiI
MNEKNIYIIRCGEIALKGQNKPFFERLLVERIKKGMKNYEDVKVQRSEGLIYLYAPKEYEIDKIIEDVSKIFGVDSISHAIEVESDMDKIGEAAVSYMLNLIKEKGIKTFKVEAKRADKDFPIQSPQMARTIGGKVLIGCKVLSVDVHKPDCRLFIDLRKFKTYIYTDKVAGFGGLPIGTNGRGMVLLSGGIDSPVAAWMMAKRGMWIEATHFHAYPYTSERAKEKVVDLAKILALQCGKIKINNINLVKIQQEISEKCQEQYITIISRRFMMKIAEILAKENLCQMLITGENLGQVASQTVLGIVATDQAVGMPVMRPLIAMDKVDIMKIARKIGTFETSIQPYEDCCTIFLPKHPSTRPKIEDVLREEGLLNIDQLIEQAIETLEVITVDIDE